jgi:uracil-DNA glycosylase
MNLFDQIAKSWQPVLEPEFSQAYIAKLEAFLETEWAAQTVFPPKSEVFSALELTPFENVRVLIVGQDPYHNDGQAHGLAFSVRPGIKVPPSLRNIFKELETDLGIVRSKNGFLEPWARQGVLLLNTSLTVRAHAAGSHKGQGWETLTDAIIRAVSGKAKQVVFVLWGAPAGKKLVLIDSNKHTVVRSAHPSPLSAHDGFFGSRPFSKINAALLEVGESEIDWRLES